MRVDKQQSHISHLQVYLTTFLSSITLLVYDGGMNVVLIEYSETIKTEDVNEQKTD